MDLLNSSNASIADYAPLVDDCRILMNRIPRWKLKHCSREANACADQLARIALHLQQPLVLLDTPLVEVSFRFYYMTSPVLDVIGFVLILALGYVVAGFALYIFPDYQKKKKKKKTIFTIIPVFHFI